MPPTPTQMIRESIGTHHPPSQPPGETEARFVSGGPREGRYSGRMIEDIAGIDYRWRSPVTDDELHALTVSHGGRPEAGWWDRIRPHSLGWVTARLPGRAL